VDDYPEQLRRFRDQLEGRSMLVHKARMAPVECVARGYLSGSGWKDYKATGSLCGIQLPAGLRESDRLPEPIFTPSTKATVGHDENISYEGAVEAAGAETAAKLKELTLKVYTTAADYALTKGIILADTKFEFGYVGETMVLADEVLTPDSSRFWPADQYKPGGAQPSFDKQYVRDWLEEMKWNKQPPAPALPEAVARRTAEKYREAYERLVGKPLP
jgi:phosphoribosylaminoimidazole-succinocarboxamide synthase